MLVHKFFLLMYKAKHRYTQLVNTIKTTQVIKPNFDFPRNF